ncbi:YopX family protein [Levilactobacillus brevis]|uniref:YopX family protein n=2 Tax=Levilactobacillus brevis TaxID=1580 RepID=UPI002072E2FC|nr:YopX family protein [Levilactobacillus brevis]MCM6799452.1 YopX family protein [Levilactobacillus brevis]MCM6801849.1 YopX family protein [Levilactobacillus brevis]MCM6807494.1 YopX family protein [Levilactobacillus brevis]MCM6813378.1 YopX family protein [Levilactobacillus brevis]MCM6815406.1 YopX family protein [Levilactobacillus brevis]
MIPKFRVWDETQHKMLQVDCIEFIDGKAYWVEASPADGNVQGGNDGPVGDNSQLKLEQYTGLKDANGKEIYEGDILATSSKIGGKLITDYLKVDWREDYAGFFCGETPLYACLSEWNNDIKYPQTFPEIAGNAHENPELLEVQHG